MYILSFDFLEATGTTILRGEPNPLTRGAVALVSCLCPVLHCNVHSCGESAAGGREANPATEFLMTLSLDFMKIVSKFGSLH